MKIIENGLIITDTACCNNCKSIFEIDSYDLYLERFGMFSSRPAYKCPICGTIQYYTGKKIKIF